MSRMTEAQLRTKIIQEVQQANQNGETRLDSTKLNSIDINAIIEEINSHWSIVIWDKVSPINGVDAAFVIERYEIEPDDSVYLIVNDGKVVFFQPFEPNVSGKQKMNSQNVQQIARNYLDPLLDQIVVQVVLPMLER